jgi:hypothetical protein
MSATTASTPPAPSAHDYHSSLWISFQVLGHRPQPQPGLPFLTRLSAGRRIPDAGAVVPANRAASS